MISIVIDTQNLLSEYSTLTVENINSMLDNIAKGIAASFAQELTLTAEHELKTSRKRYVDNIRVVDAGKLEGTVLLDYSKDPLVKMLEEGAAPFDMKEGFLNSPKVKTGKNGGKYLTIPFRQATPGAIGESDVFAFKMDPGAYKIVQNKIANIPVPGGGVRSAGIALKELPTNLQATNKRASIIDNKGNELFKQYEHKAPISQGITKYQDSATGQNSYRSFRRVSENSDPSAFIHPGIQKYNLIQKTLGSFDTGSRMSELLDMELSKLGLI